MILSQTVKSASELISMMSRTWCATGGSELLAAFACAIMAAVDVAGAEPLLLTVGAAPLLRAVCACASMAPGTPPPADPTNAKMGGTALRRPGGVRCPRPRAAQRLLERNRLRLASTMRRSRAVLPWRRITASRTVGMTRHLAGIGYNKLGH